MRVFLDASVLFSAANPGSGSAALFDLLRASHVVVTSDFAVLEARRNIATKRPAWSAPLDRLLGRVEIVTSIRFPLPVVLDEKDAPILCAAICAGCQILVTGDRKHFAHLFGETVVGVKVLTPLGLAEMLTATRSGEGG